MIGRADSRKGLRASSKRGAAGKARALSYKGLQHMSARIAVRLPG
jgi:hypothetical protein